MEYRAGDFNRKDTPQFWRLKEVDDVIIKASIESNPHNMTSEIVETLSIHHSNVYNHLNKLQARYLGSS